MELLHPMLCSFTAFAALCLAMERHHEDALAHAPSARRVRRLRVVAGLAFLASWWTVLPRVDYGIAWTMWTFQLTAGGFAVVALATWWPRRLPAAAIAVGAASVLLLALSAPVWR